MPKRIVEDVIPPERRSIRNIPLPETRSPSFSNEDEVISVPKPVRENIRRAPVQENVQPRPISRPVPRQQVPPEKPPKVKRSKKKLFTILVVLILIVLVGIGLSFAFANATVTVTPKHQTLPVNISLTAHTEPGNGDVLYQTVTMTREKSVEVTATGEENVERKASGSIIIYNNFSGEPQVLVKNTRFRIPSGLIYRIQEQVSVPGKKGTTPGSLKVVVYADEAGEKYNTGLQDLVIPGFESDPARYKAIFAKSDPASPLKGGFVGKVKKISPTDKAAADLNLEAELKKEVSDMIAAQVPAGYMSINNGLSLVFEDLPQTAGTNPNTAFVGRKVTAQAIIVNSTEFEERIIQITSGDEENGPKTMKIGNLSSLPVTLDKTPTTEDPSIKLGITGDIDFISKVDTQALASNLAGKSRKNMKSILSSYDSIEKAEAVIRPLWSTSFPNNAEKVYIEVLEP